MALHIVIMAAGKGTRMKSALPKVLHRSPGRSLLQHVLNATVGLGAHHTLVITGHGADEVEAAVAASGAWLRAQMPQLGTGHAIQQAVPELPDDDSTTLILNGDVPLIAPETARRAGRGRRAGPAGAADHRARRPHRLRPHPARRCRPGAGHRRAQGRQPAQRAIREGYTGMMAAPTGLAAPRGDGAEERQRAAEYYLTDIVAMAVAEGLPVVATPAPDETEVLGVNSPLQLADLERRLQRRRPRR
jgi:bifunctional UDP-N-acetylglucosamine pyrophosphorylase/glucosamine-1-phosphate N-acetyltransferase